MKVKEIIYLVGEIVVILCDFFGVMWLWDDVFVDMCKGKIDVCGYVLMFVV